MKAEGISTLMQIDLQYLFHGARNIGGAKIDFDKIMEHIVDRDTENLTKAIVYLIRNEKLFDSRFFENRLKGTGYTIKAKNAIKSVRDDKVVYMASQEVPLTIDCIDLLHTFDKLILMSGNGAFTDLCKYLQKKGKKVELWCFEKDHNRELCRQADKCHFISGKFFLRSPNVQIFGFNMGDLK
jgi:uncharacterized LabA/DUF88 family protein